MSTDEDLGQWLRRELVRHESQGLPAPGLAKEALTGARRAERRRAGLVGLSAASVTAAVAIGAFAFGGADEPEEGDQQPTAPTSRAAPKSGDWTSTLPAGEPPEVAYATQTALHLPTGRVVDLGGTGADVIGDTVAGTILLVERDARDDGGGFESWYVVVSPDGTLTRVASGRATGARVQKAVVSPDGRWFSDGRIFDLSTGVVTGTLPDEADILLAWTPTGIVYGAGDAAFLWSPGGSAPVELDDWPAAYANGTDIGLGRRKGCPVVVELAPDGTEAVTSRHCGVTAMAVSPGGSWLLTDELVAIDTVTGEEHPLTDGSVRGLGQAWDAHWLDEDEVLISVPAGRSAILVRCRVESSSCKRATEPLGDFGPNGRLLLP